MGILHSEPNSKTKNSQYAKEKRKNQRFRTGRSKKWTDRDCYNEDDGVGALGADGGIDGVLDAAGELVLLQVLLDRHGGGRKGGLSIEGGDEECGTMILCCCCC